MRMLLGIMNGLEKHLKDKAILKNSCEPISGANVEEWHKAAVGFTGCRLARIIPPAVPDISGGEPIYLSFVVQYSKTSLPLWRGLGPFSK